MKPSSFVNWNKNRTTCLDGFKPNKITKTTWEVRLSCRLYSLLFTLLLSSLWGFNNHTYIHAYIYQRIPKLSNLDYIVHINFYDQLWPVFFDRELARKVLRVCQVFFHYFCWAVIHLVTLITTRWRLVCRKVNIQLTK